mmetsp:Transcript_62624/g.166184  ORF Transcript_62624/g.166184 Transcript_62624/m.166184 type:complete len:217 (+) Transcript_62624:324-974(+)
MWISVQRIHLCVRKESRARLAAVSHRGEFEHVSRLAGHVEISPAPRNARGTVLEEDVMANILVERVIAAHCPILERLSFPLVTLDDVSVHVRRVDILRNERHVLEELRRHGSYTRYESAAINSAGLGEEDAARIEEQGARQVGGGRLGRSVHEWKAFLRVGHRLNLAFFSVAVVKLALRSTDDWGIGIQSERRREFLRPHGTLLAARARIRMVTPR